MNHEDDYWLDHPIVTVDPDLTDLIPMFMENRRKDIATIENALEQGDFETIRATGHSMKGSGSGYGFHGVSKLGEMLEDAAKEKDTEMIRQYLAALGSYMARVQLRSEE